MNMAGTVVMGAVAVLSGLVDLAAIVVAIARWQRHPTVSMLVVVSMIIALVIRGGYFVLPRVIDLAGGSNTYMLASGALSLVGTLNFALLVVAIFIERGTPADPPAQRW